MKAPVPESTQKPSETLQTPEASATPQSRGARGLGFGPVTVFNDGNVIEGTWRRNDINEPFTFTDTEQNIIQVPPSSQWVHIVPTDGEITWSDS